MASKKLQIVINAVDNASKKFKQIDKTLKEHGSSLDSVASKIKMTGIAMTAFGGIMAGKAIQMSANFEQSMSNINTLFDDNGESIIKLKDGIKSLLKTVPKSSEDLGSSAYAIVSAGILDTNKALITLKYSSQLAVAGLGTTAEATDIVTSAINSFGIDSSKSQQIANTFFLAVKSGKTTVADLARGFGQVAPLASQMNVSLEDLMSTTAALTTGGMKASIVYASLRAVFSNILKPTREMEDALKKTKLTFEDVKKSLEEQGLINTIRMLTDIVGGNTDEVAKMFGSVEGLNSVLSLMNETGDNALNIFDTMKNNTDALTIAYEKQSKTAIALYQVLKNNLEVAMIDLGNKILPSIIPLVKNLTNIIGKLNPEILKWATVLFLVIGPSLIIIGFLPTLVSGFKLLIIAIKAFRSTTIITTLSTITFKKALIALSHPMKIIRGIIPGLIIMLKGLRGALLAIPLTIAITVALIGFVVVMNQIKKLNKEIDAQIKSEDDLYTMRMKEIKKYRNLKQSEDEDIKKYAQAHLNHINNVIMAQENGTQTDLKGSREKIQSIKNELNEKGKLIDAQNILNGIITKTNDIPPPSPIPPEIPAGIDKLTDKWDNYKNKVEEVSDSLKESLSEVKSQIKNLQGEMEQLLVGNVKENLSVNQSYAEEYVKQEEKVADLQKQINEETDFAKRENLKAKLEYEKSELQRHSTILIAHENEIEEVRRRNSLSDIARAVEDLSTKRHNIITEFELKFTKMCEELEREESKQKDLEKLQKYANDMSAKMEAEKEIQTIESVNRQIDAYNDLAKAIIAAREGRLSAHSVISGQTYGTSKQNIQAPVINVYGDVSGEELINKVKNGIMGDFLLNNKV